MDTPSTPNGDHLGAMICGCIICSSPSTTSAEITFCWFRKMPSYGGEKRPKMKMGANRIQKKNVLQVAKRQSGPHVPCHEHCYSRPAARGNTLLVKQPSCARSESEKVPPVVIRKKKKDRTLETVAIFSADNRCHSENICESSSCCFALWSTYAEVVF